MVGIFPEIVKEKSVKLLGRVSLDTPDRNPEPQESERFNARKARMKKNGSEKMAPEQKRCRRMERQLSRKQIRAEKHQAMIASKPKKKPNRRTCRRRSLPPGAKRPQSPEVCAYRRRLYARYAIRCELKNRKLKYVPPWWRDEVERDRAITMALQ